MPVYTIDLALHSACHDYAGLIAALRNLGARPVMGKRWLIEGDTGPATAALLRHCAPGDALHVIELSCGAADGRPGGLTPGATSADPRRGSRRSRPAAPSG